MLLLTSLLFIVPVATGSISGILLHEGNSSSLWSPNGQVQDNLHLGLPDYDMQTAIYMNGKVFLLGGRSEKLDEHYQEFTADVFIFDPVTLITTKMSPMTTQGQGKFHFRDGALAALISLPNGSQTILACGGHRTNVGLWNGCSLMGDNHVWSEVATPPTKDVIGSIWSSMTVVNGKAYLIGGLDYTTGCYSYDATSNTWTLESTYVARKLSGHSAVNIHSSTIYIAGGAEDKVTLASSRQVITYDTVTKIWTLLPQEQWLNIPRDTFQLVNMQGRLYVIGGKRDGVVQTTSEVRALQSPMWSLSSRGYNHTRFAAVYLPN